MNRRDFTRSLAALGLAPAVSGLPNLTIAAPAPPPAFTPYMYGLGAHMARATGLCSVDMLSQKLALSPAAAQAMQAKLIQSGVISAPNATGIAMATQPYMAAIRFKTAAATIGKTGRRYAQAFTKATQPTETSTETPEADPA